MNNRRKVRLALAQSNLRPLLFNFYPFLHRVELDPKDLPKIKPHEVYNVLPPYAQEIRRRKGTGWRFKLRQIIGIPSIRFLHDQKHDVIFSYGGFLFSNKPYVVYLENDAAPYSYNAAIARHPLARWLVSLCLKSDKCRALVFMSHACQRGFLAPGFLADPVRRIVAAKSHVLSPIAHNPGHAAPASRRDGIIRFLFIGSFYMKGGRELLSAFIRLAQEYDNVRLTLVTREDLLARDDYEQIKYHARIALVTNQYDPPELFKLFYNTHDVFIYPTYRDSFGAVLVEALAAGLPIITTDHYATVEMAIAGVNAFVYLNHPLKDYNQETGRILGRYYSPRDFYQDLFSMQKNGRLQPIVDFIYQSMKQLVQDKYLREKMSEASINHYRQNYDWQKIAASWDEIFTNATVSTYGSRS